MNPLELAMLMNAGFIDETSDEPKKFVKPCTFQGRPDGTVIIIWVLIKQREDRFLVQAYDHDGPVSEGYPTPNLADAISMAEAVMAGHEEPL